MTLESSIPEPYAKWPTLARHWKAVFGERVQRISIDPGFGCPNRDEAGRGGCIFCDPASFAPSAGDERTVTRQIRSAIDRLAPRGVGKFAAYFQPRTNTFAPLDQLRRIWDEAAAFDCVVALCIGTRPDCVPGEVLDLLAGYGGRFGEIWLELGLQSSHDATLEAIGRGHDAAAFCDAVSRAHARGLKVCAHVILGLPGEDAGMEARTAAWLGELGVEGVKLHQLAVVKGTRLEELYRTGEVKTLTEGEYARRAAAFIKELPRTTVLHRLVGDTLGDHLIAPRFDKARVLGLIRREL